MDDRSQQVKAKVEADRPGGVSQWSSAKMLSNVKLVPKSFVIETQMADKDIKSVMTPHFTPTNK